MIKDDTNELTLTNSRVDYVASAAKSALGTVPFAGALLAEIAGTVIPNQRIDRIVKFAETLELRLSKLEENAIENNISQEDFTDLVEESLRQAARSLTDERRDYIAALVANSISSKEIEHYESKHLLRMLGELNDIEIIWLRFYLDPTIDGDEEYREKHTNILSPVGAHLASEQPEIDRATLQESYKEHMVSLGLLEKEIDIDISGIGSKLKTRGFNITNLGKLLLRQVGFSHQRIR